MIRGFILDTSCVPTEDGPLVRIYGRTEDDRPFLVRERRFRPYFFVDERRKDTVPRHTDTELRAMTGEALVRVQVGHPAAVMRMGDELAAQGARCFEADLRASSRFLIDHGLKGGVGIEGPHKESGGLLLFDNPEMTPARVTPPKLKVLSIDIETDAKAEHVTSVALAGCGETEAFIVSEEPVVGAKHFATETGLMNALNAAVHARDPDIITGWNVIDFDLAVLKRVGNLRLGRDGSEPYIRQTKSFWNSSQAQITGRVVLDGIALLRSAFVTMEEYRLDYVAKEVLGVGKTAHGLDEIMRLYREDKARFIEYNKNDAELVLRILDKLGLVALAVERSLLTGMPLDRVAASIASFDSLYLPELRKRGLVAPSVLRDGDHEPMQGGLVLEPAPGAYKNVLVFDFKSLYPSVIRTFNVDPAAHAAAGKDDDIIAPNGARFSREPGILPAILDDLFPAREAAKRNKNEVASHAIKILMNSLYGVLGSPSCRFFDGAVSNAITSFGREILLWSKARFEAAGHRVLYGDTDSLFVHAGTDDPEEAARIADRLLASLNDALGLYVREKYGVTSKLELEHDSHYLRLFLPKMRQSEGGARKRYVGLTRDGEVVFTGMEVVRRDWTELAKRVQRELYERWFSDRPVGEYLRAIVRAVRDGKHDDLLVYKKALRKPLESYTASTPPHVAAARKSDNTDRLIAYVVTTKGPEPVGAIVHPIDRMHYVEKQIRPVCEPILDVLGLDFDAVAEIPGQLRLL